MSLFTGISNTMFNLASVSVYDSGALSIQELISEIVGKINGLLTNVEQFEGNVAKQIDYLTGEGLDTEVAKKLLELKNNGELANIINKTIFDKLSKEVDLYGYLNPIQKYSDLVVNGDWTTAIKTALKNDNYVYLPEGTYNITGTIQLTSNQKLIGSGMGTVINYTGDNAPKETIFLLGTNTVGAVPNNMSEKITISGLNINGNNRIGFGIYGTFIQNHCEVSNIRLTGTLQHALYISKGWYNKFVDITADKNKGCGLSFAVPLSFNDSSVANWSSDWDALHLNCNLIQNVRSELAGFDKLYNQKTNPKWGYGLGFGGGEGFYVTNFLAETSYGVGVYIYRANDIVMNIKNGYIERNTLGRNDGKGTDIIPLLFDINDVNAKYIKLEDIYINQDDPVVNMMLTGNAVPTSGSIILENIAGGGGIKILNNAPMEVFHIKNCWWRMSSGGFDSNGCMTFANGYPVNVCEGTMEIQPNNVSTTIKLPTGFNKALRRLYVYSEKQATSVSNFYKDNTAQITVFYKNADPEWCRLPKEMEPYKLYPLCDIGQFPTYMQLANDNAIGTKLNFVLFDYTGDKPTYI